MRKLIIGTLLLLLAAPAFAGDHKVSTSGGVTVVTAMPGSPTTGDIVVVTDDSAVDACDSSAGTSKSACLYDGSSWVPLTQTAGIHTWSAIQSLVTPSLLGKVDANDTAVNDNVCNAADLGKFWFDSTDVRFEWCPIGDDATAPSTLAATTGDIGTVGDCTTGDCFEGAGVESAIKSTVGIIIHLDDDNDSTSTFSILDGANASVFEIEEDGDVFGTTFTADASATPSVGFDDSVAAGTESQIVGNATADNNGSLDFQVEEAAATYFSALRIDSTAGAVVLQLGGTAANNDISISEAGVMTFAGTAIPLKSIPYTMGGLISDGTQCAQPASANINTSGPMYTVLCLDNDAGIIYGQNIMPDGWDGGTVKFRFQASNTAADVGVYEFDFSALCRADGDALDSTYGSEPGSPASITFTTANDIETSSETTVTPNGTCTGDATLLKWRASLDATATTTVVATAHVTGIIMEYGTSALSD